MSVKKIHLGWFLNFSAPQWTGPLDGSSAKTWTTGEFHTDIVKDLERGMFDFAMFEDSSMVSDVHNGSMEADLKYSLYAPKGDPLPLMSKIAAQTKHIGLIATASTSFYPPFITARMYATLDGITEGRIGWNVVTSSEDRAAQNFGHDKLFEHDNRYEMADEYVEVVKKLWNSWEPDAIRMDHEHGIYADHTKVHPIDHDGKYYKVRGPLNVMPGPQREVALCQAGGSPAGRDLAAKHANAIVTQVNGIAEMKAYRDDIRARMEKFGRNPDDCKVLFVVVPVIDETDELAQAKAAREAAPTDAKTEVALAHLSSLTNVDFGQFDLDGPVPDVSTNGHRTTLEGFLKKGDPGIKTLRDAANVGALNAVNFVGSPATVAAQMRDVMEEVGGDGFLISGPMSRARVGGIVDGLVPALQNLGLVRTKYEHKTLKENLLAF